MGRNNNDGCGGCLTIISALVGLFLIGTIIRQCQCALIKLADEEPPYISTDDDRYHRRHCPYMTEDNYVGDEYDSRESAEFDGLTPCPHCLD